MDAIADVELGDGPCGKGVVEEPCRNKVRNDGGTEGNDDTAGGLRGLPEPGHRAASGP